MAIAFYMDEHIPKPITLGLRVRGVDVLTVQEDKRRGEDDPVLMDRATALGRVMFAFDSDMLQEATRRQSIGEPFSGVVLPTPIAFQSGIVFGTWG